MILRTIGDEPRSRALRQRAVWILRFILPLASGILLGSALVIFFEDRMIYHPVRYPGGEWDITNSSIRIEDQQFISGDGIQLHGWFIPSDSGQFVLLWCHGNAGNITHRLDNIKKLLPLGLSVFIFDYRGYGKSEGTPSEEGLYLDAVAAYDHLTSAKGIAPENIILFGRSLGASVAVDLALQRKARALILESAFTSAKDMASVMLPYIPVGLFITSRFDAISKIKRVKLPLLMLHGDSDSVVPIELGRRLYAAANSPKSFHEIPDADHNDTYIVGGTAYFSRIADFLSAQVE